MENRSTSITIGDAGAAAPSPKKKKEVEENSYVVAPEYKEKFRCCLTTASRNDGNRNCFCCRDLRVKCRWRETSARCERKRIPLQEKEDFVF